MQDHRRHWSVTHSVNSELFTEHSVFATNKNSKLLQIIKILNISANEERRDMQGLNDRLASFLNRLRQMQANAGQMDTSAYHAAIKNLEDEIAKLKSMYDAELDRLR